MSKNMTPKQVNKFIGNIRAMLEKHALNFPSDAVQAVLGDPDFAAQQFTLFRERVEARSGVIVRDFSVDLSLVGMDAVNATGRAFYGDKNVVANMPRATLPEGKLQFFQTGRYTPVGEVDAEYAKRGLRPVDPHTLCAFNAANPEFADTHPNGTQWKDIKGNFCCACFDRSSGERGVFVLQFDVVWGDDWWFAGVGK
jgi:hypothetical protein